VDHEDDVPDVSVNPGDVVHIKVVDVSAEEVEHVLGFQRLIPELCFVRGQGHDESRSRIIVLQLDDSPVRRTADLDVVEVPSGG
jgi:hypothetical protein